LTGMSNVRKLLIPCYAVTLRNSKTYFLDAYFMKSLKVPARRSLMIYPPEGRVSSTAWGDTKLLEPSYSVDEALGMLREAYLWSCERRLNRAKTVLSRFRASLLFPIAVFRKIESDDDLVRDSELAGAIYILEGVFGRRSLLEKLNIIRSEVTHVEVSVSLDEDRGDITVTSSNNSVARAYAWLYRNDENFNKALTEVLRN